MKKAADPIADGETVILIDRKGKEYLLEIKKGMTFHTGDGMISHESLIGKTDGSTVLSPIKRPFILLRPTLSQLIMNMPREAQIIYPKDIGIILMWADIFSGARVVEIGAGFGALTMALARAVGKTGLLVSYEKREDVANKVLKNIERYLGKRENVIIKNKDALEGIDEEDVDRIITDVPQPWHLLDSIERSLSPGGILLNFLPTIIQSREITESFKKRKTFGLVQTIETLLRPWNIEGLSVRPVHRMTAHTGFITTSRKLATG